MHHITVLIPHTACSLQESPPGHVHAPFAVMSYICFIRPQRINSVDERGPIVPLGLACEFSSTGSSLTS